MSSCEQVIQAGKFEWFYRETAPIGQELGTVVLLHGIPSLSHSWTAVMPALGEQGFRSIAPDWLGFGQSGKPEKRDFSYTPDAYIAALKDLFQQLKLEKVSLVVQGYLGSVGLQYALRYPEQIDRIAILNTPITPDCKLPWQLQQMTLPLAGEMMTQDPLLVDRTLEGGSRYRIEDKDLDVYRRPFLKTSSAGRSLLFTLRNLQLKTATAEISQGFGQWEKPVLVIWGTEDPWLPLQEAENFVQGVAKGSLTKLPEAGHYAQEHWSNLISEELILFLRR